MSFINLVRKLTALKNIFLSINKLYLKSLSCLENWIPAYCYPVDSYYDNKSTNKNFPIYFSKQDNTPNRRIIFTDKDLLESIKSPKTNKKKRKRRNVKYLHKKRPKYKNSVVSIEIPAANANEYKNNKSKEKKHDNNPAEAIKYPVQNENKEINTNEYKDNKPEERIHDNNTAKVAEDPVYDKNKTKDNTSIEKTKNDNLTEYTEIPEFEAQTKSCRFCTIASNEYLLKVLALHKSLKNSAENFSLWICCMDEESYSTLSRLKLYNAYIFRVEKIEDNELLSVKNFRKANEYCWTLKSPLIKYILDTYKIPDIVYCDSDLCFFSDPKAIYGEWGNYDVFLCPQRDLQWVENIYGKYQAGLIGFKNTVNAFKCLSFWRNKCIEWCSSNPEPGMERFGDQKYLDKLPVLFQGVKISENLGVNAAPWNCIYNNNYNIYEKDSFIYIGKDRLVAFHFATVNIYNDSEFDLWSFNYIPIGRTIKDKIYLPYLNLIRECINMVKAANVSNLNLLFSQKPLSGAQTYYRYPPLNFRIKADDKTKYFCTIISKKYLIRGLALYRSLEVHAKNFHMWICCVDETSYSAINRMGLKNVTLIPLDVLEDDGLRECRKNRNINEFCWTLKAPLVQYVLTNYDIDYIIYCDADIFFFADPSPILQNWIGYYFYICTQRDNSESERVHGRFQAGFIGFKKHKEAFRILEWWRQRCIEWCFDDPQPESERWGDQKYLDKVPLQFVGIRIEYNIGINAAPWNIILNNNYNIHNVDGKVYVENDILIFYHFGSMVFYNEYEYDLWKLKPLNFSPNIIDNIYIPYLNTIEDVLRESLPYIEDAQKEIFIDKASNPPVNYFNTREH